MLLSVFGFRGYVPFPSRSLPSFCGKYPYLFRYFSNSRKYKFPNLTFRFDRSKSVEDAEREINEIESQERKQKGESIFKLLKKVSNLKHVGITMLFLTLRTFCAREPMGAYPGNFISQLKTTYDARIITITQSGVDVIICVLSTVVMDNFNRRTLLYFVGSCGALSAGGLIICQFFIKFVNSTIPWVIPVFYCIYASLITGVLFPLASLVACEMVSKSNEHRAMLYTTVWAINNTLRALFTAAFPTLINDFNIVFTLLLLMCSNLLLIVVTKLFVIETANKSLHNCISDKNTKHVDDVKHWERFLHFSLYHDFFVEQYFRRLDSSVFEYFINKSVLTFRCLF